MRQASFASPGRSLAIGLALVAGVFLATACDRAASDVESISRMELARRIQEGTAPPILDVRSSEEYEAGHIPGSVNVPHDQLSSRLAELGIPESDEVVVHCESGRRAAVAEEVLVGSGYARVRDLEGHMRGWREAGLPTE